MKSSILVFALNFMRLISLRSLGALAFGLLLPVPSQQSQAETIIWGGADGHYSVGSNWAGGNVPNTAGGDTAITNTGAVIYTPGGDLTIQNRGDLQINGGSWTQVDGIAWINLQGGTLNVAGGAFDQGTSGNVLKNSSTAGR